MSQSRYIDFGAAGNSDQLVRGLISNITELCVLGGGAITPASAASLTPSIVIAPFSVVFDDGYVIVEDSSVTAEIPNPSVSHVYTIVYEHVDSGVLFGNAAEIKFIQDVLVTTYADSVVLGWLIYDGSGGQPTPSMIWESPRGIDSGSSNCAYRDTIFPPASSLVLDSTSTAVRAGNAGIMLDQQVVGALLFGPAAPDTYVADAHATFNTYRYNTFNLASVTGEVFRMTVDCPTHGVSYVESVTANVGNFPTIASGVSAAAFVSGLNSRLVHCSAVVVSISGDNFVKISTTAAGTSATMTITGSSSLAVLYVMGILGSTHYAGWEQVDPFYNIYTAYSGASYTFSNTTQFNLKKLPHMYEWRFTVDNNALLPVFTINKAYISVNGVMYNSDLQFMEVVNQATPSTKTLGYKIRFLDPDFFADYLGGVLTVFIEASLDATLGEKKLIHYYNALYEYAYPMNACTYYEAINCGVIGGTPTLHSVT